MDDSTLTVFISSKMQELAAERTALYNLLTQMSSGPLKIKAWAYERDAPASNNSIRDVYLKILEESALYIGLFWKEYGDWTIDEFRRATEWHIDRLLFVKADEDTNRDPALQKFLTDVAPVSTGLAPVWFKDEADLCEKVTASLQAWINEKLTYRPGSANAVLVTDPDDVPHQPRKLIGRDDLLAQLRSALSQNSRVLLQGFGGMGKTALAATAAAEYLKTNPGPMLWQEIGKESSDAIFEALARPLNAVQQIAREHGAAKIQAMRALLRQTGVRLVVLDNAWDGPALKTVLEAVPRDVPVIVTSRHAYPLDLRMEVDELSPASAVETLAFYAGSPTLMNDPAAAELCQLLGYLAFALEIAGKQLMVDKLTPAQLKTRIESTPRKFEIPAEYVDAGRAILGDLLDATIEHLDPNTQAYLFPFGAFFAPQLTTKMMLCYYVPEPKLTPEQLEETRQNFKDIPDMTDLQARISVLMNYLDEIPADSVVTELDKLVERGLVQRMEATTTDATTYRILDLMYTYLQTQANDGMRSRALLACQKYALLYNDGLTEQYVFLRPQLQNLIGAVIFAGAKPDHGAVEQMVYDLHKNSKFLLADQLYAQAETLLTYAIKGSEQQIGRDGKPKYGLMTAFYELLRDLYHDIEDMSREAKISERLSRIFLAAGSPGGAQRASLQAFIASAKAQDKAMLGRSMSAAGDAFHAAGDVTTSIKMLQEALRMARRNGDKFNEANTLGRLGHAFASSGEFQRSIAAYDEALPIVQALSDKQAEASTLTNLGSAYFSLNNPEKAVEYYQQARLIYSSLDNPEMLTWLDERITKARPANETLKPRKGWFRR